MTGRADRSMGTAVDGQLRSRDVSLGVGMKGLAYFLPLLASASEGTHAEGTLTLDMDLGAGATRPRSGSGR